MAEHPIWTVLLLTLFIIICVLLVIVVLLQKGRGGGIGAAFGGMGSTAFGTRTGDVFTWVTIVLTALFLLVAVGSTLLVRPKPIPLSALVFTPSPKEPIDRSITVKISLSEENQSAEKPEIYYTLDGSTPARDEGTSSQYKSGVLIAPGTTIKAIAYAEERASSPVGESALWPEAADQRTDPDQRTGPNQPPRADDCRHAAGESPGVRPSDGAKDEIAGASHMLRSMTGFGSAIGKVEGIEYAVEIRSVNHRYFKASVKLPESWAGADVEIEQKLRHALQRGAITCTVRMKIPDDKAACRVNAAALNSYIEQLPLPGGRG